MRTIHILFDSLNRHYLSAYNPDAWIKTPNIDRLAARGRTFEKHFVGSLPCMPARREMMTGRLNFLEDGWSPMMPWDVAMPKIMHQNGIYSHLITDHYHYFHAGGDGYHTAFKSWEFIRGQENDVWRPVIPPPEAPEGTRGKALNAKAYWANQQKLDKENDLAYSTPQCFERAMEFLDTNHGADDWHLQLECFDPHEPFDCPKKYRDMYDDDWDKYHYSWPEYAPCHPELDDAEAIAHVRKCYAGTLTMADAWLGRFLDKMDDYDMWKDTTLILTTDHGHLLGEHGYWAKNYMFDYAELTHIPMIACSPDAEAGSRVDSLTATIDLMPTFMDLHKLEPPESVQGKSIKHLFTDEADHHDAVLYGYFAQAVNLTDGRYTYCRQPEEGSTLYSYTIPSCSKRVPPDKLKEAEFGPFLPYTDYPVFKIEQQSVRQHKASDEPLIYDITKDPEQSEPVENKDVKDRLSAKMRELLERYQAPPEQFKRLGLTKK